MIDVKLTLVGCGGPPTNLYEWVDGVHAWSFSVFGELLEDRWNFLYLSVRVLN